MKTQLSVPRLTILVFCLLASTTCSRVFAQGTAFTYQGRFTDSGAPYTGNAEFQATLWDAVSGGSQIAANSPAQVVVGITNGLFVLPLDFGANFPGANRWLQLEVRTTIGSFTPLTPRQPLTPAPYAITASNLSGTLPAGQLSGPVASANFAGTYSSALTLNNAANSFSGSGTGLTALSASELTSGTVPDARLGANVARTNQVWLLGGNAGANPTNGAFLGTTDNLPLEIKVNNQRAWRIEYATNTANGDSPNIIAGRSNNSLASGLVGATISGGGRSGFGNQISADFGTVGGGWRNLIQSGANESTVGGGSQNIITNSFQATIGGGSGNRIIGAELGGLSTIGGGANNTMGVTNFGAGVGIIEGGHFIGGGNANRIGQNLQYASISGGGGNNIQSSFAAVGGGDGNIIEGGGFEATIAGGHQNTNSGQYAVIPGGEKNAARGDYSLAAGRRAKANHNGTFVWADSQNADFSSTTSNLFLIRASGGVGIGTGSPSRELEVQHAGDTEIGIKSTDIGGHLWTIQSTALTGSANLDASFQIIDRTLGGARLFIGTNGFVGIGTSNPTNKLHVAGGVSATVFVTTSDRNAKENFAPVSSRDILEKVVALPVTQWSFKEMPGAMHIGPMAQDFYAAFKVGAGSTGIATVDADGVALAAIQGLNQKVEEKETRISTLERELSELKQTVKKLLEGKN